MRRGAAVRRGTAMRRGAAWLCLVAWLATPLAIAQGEPGSLLALEARGSLSAAQIDGVVAGRFRRDGETPPRATTGVDAYLVHYVTTGPSGGQSDTIAQLYVPHAARSTSLLAFAPGSTGLDPTCNPTRVWLATGRVETYGASALAYAGQGLTTVLPDYLSRTVDTELQPYFVATAEATVMLDALRAARNALETVRPGPAPTHAFVAGYSQGGHAAFATADRAAVYAEDVPLAGIVGFGPTGDLDNLFRYFHYAAPWVVRAYQAAYPGMIEPADVLVEPYAARLDDDVRRMCVLQAQRSYPTAPSALFTDAFFASLEQGTLAEEFPAWRTLFDSNDTGIQPHGLPIAIFQGVNDPVVPLTAQDDFVMRLCTLGNPVRYANYLRTRHETRYIAFHDALDWMRTVADGAPPPNDCPEVLAR